MAKTINAVFTSGVFTRTAKVFQWDSGDKLAFVNVDLPNSYQVHFANSLTGASKTVLGDSTGVAIPPEYFVPGSEIYAWVWVSTENGGYTKYQVTIPIYRRAQPQNVTPTPAQIDALDEAIATLNDAIESGIITPEEKQKLAGIEAGAEVNKVESVGYSTPDGGNEYAPGPYSGTLALLPDYLTPLVYEFAWDGTDVTSTVIWNDVFGGSDAVQKYAYVTDDNGYVLKLRLILADKPTGKNMRIAFYGIDEEGNNYLLHMGESTNAWAMDVFNPEEDSYTTGQYILGKIGNLDDLTTTAKNNLVAAINEAAASGGALPSGGSAGQFLKKTANGEEWSGGVVTAVEAHSNGTNGGGKDIKVTTPSGTTYVDPNNSAVFDITVNLSSTPAAVSNGPGHSALATAYAAGKTIFARVHIYGDGDNCIGQVQLTNRTESQNDDGYWRFYGYVTPAAGQSSFYLLLEMEDGVWGEPALLPDEETLDGNIAAKIDAPSSPSVGDFLMYTANGWAAQSLSTWQGGNY